MDGVDGARRRRRSLKERLGLKGMGCCGTTWVFGGTNVRDNNIVDDDDDDEEEDVVVIDVGLGQAPPGQNPDPLCVSPVTSGSGMNLAAALAAERQLRASHEPERVASVGPTDSTVGGTTTAPGTPFRVSLMRLLEETDGGDEETTMVTEKEKEKEKGAVEGNDSVCCVCMVRKKGAAFIPCGHTFCRVCSRELWLNRGSCPLCNRSILEILDIF